MFSKPQMNPASLYNRQLQWFTGSVIFVFFIAGFCVLDEVSGTKVQNNKALFKQPSLT